MTSIASGVTNPMTPEQSRAQVVDAAHDVVRIVAEPVASANFWRSSCNDQGDPPFRGVVSISYPPPADPAAAASALEHMKIRLQAAGWSADGDFQTHGTALKKNGVDAALYPADASVPVNVVELHGECRDMTTTKAGKGDVEDLAL